MKIALISFILVVFLATSPFAAWDGSVGQPMKQLGKNQYGHSNIYFQVDSKIWHKDGSVTFIGQAARTSAFLKQFPSYELWVEMNYRYWDGSFVRNFQHIQDTRKTYPGGSEY